MNGRITVTNLLNTKRVFRFYLQPMPEKILILKKIERDMMKIYIFLRVMYPLLLSDFNYT